LRGSAKSQRATDAPDESRLVRGGVFRETCDEVLGGFPMKSPSSTRTKDGKVIDVFEILLATLDAIPPSLITAAEELRAAEPDRFEHILNGGLASVGYGFSPDSATELVEVDLSP
jgi:hypothetical protein